MLSTSATPRPMNRSLHVIPLGLAVCVALGCNPPNAYQAPQPPDVTVAAPLVQTVTDYLEETGSTEAVQLVQIRARVRGFIESVEFEVDKEVEAGDLLYIIEKKLYEAEVEKAKAEVATANAQYENADARYKTGVPLVEKGALPREELDQRKADRAVALASIYSAQAKLKEAQINLGYCQVTTPISGRVGKTLVKQGNLVDGAEATHLTSVVNYDNIYANFNISERVYQRIIENPPHRQPGETIDKTKVIMYVSRYIDGDKFPFEGHLDYWDLAVDESTGTYAIRGIFPNPDRRLAPGMTVTVHVPMAPIKDALLVPEGSISVDQTGRYVLVVNEEDKVKRRAVTLEPNARFEGMRVVLDGLTKDDRVVVEGLQRARLDAQVKPTSITLPRLKTDGVQTFDSASKEGDPIVQSPPPEPLDESAAALFDAGDATDTTDGEGAPQ